MKKTRPAWRCSGRLLHNRIIQTRTRPEADWPCLIWTPPGPALILAGLEKALQDHPDDPVILNRIGTVQEHQGAFEKAAATYETALKQNPDAIPIMAKLARLYASRLNQPKKALSLATGRAQAGAG